YSPGASPLASIRGYLAEGYAAGAWNGLGIDTSAADADHALGYTDTGNAVVVRFTRLGDANLDGLVNFADVLDVVQHYGRTDAGWSDGDFNYDGAVNFRDLLTVVEELRATNGA